MFNYWKKSNNISRPLFEGTKQDFHKYFSGFCRNLIQKITKPYKYKIGCCQQCGVSDIQLDAAHVRGKGRKEIIDTILRDYQHEGVIKLNLKTFEDLFIEHHEPIEETIKILCKSCHKEYDTLTDDELTEFYNHPPEIKNVIFEKEESKIKQIFNEDKLINYEDKFMLEGFKNYLIQEGYSEFTPSGKPSTVYDYMKRVEKICAKEKITTGKLVENINFYLDKYGPNGNESEFGKRSHNAFISALRKFESYLTYRQGVRRK